MAHDEPREHHYSRRYRSRPGRGGPGWGGPGRGLRGPGGGYDAGYVGFAGYGPWYGHCPVCGRGWSSRPASRREERENLEHYLEGLETEVDDVRAALREMSEDT